MCVCVCMHVKESRYRKTYIYRFYLCILYILKFSIFENRRLYKSEFQDFDCVVILILHRISHWYHGYKYGGYLSGPVQHEVCY